MRSDSTPPAEHETARPGRRRSAQAHEAILDATLEKLHDVGFAGLTIEGVAARAGVGKTTVYRWWPTKNGLVIEALDRYLDAAPLQPTGDSRADIRALIQRIADTFARPPLGDVLPALAVDLTRDPEAAEQFRKMMGPRRAANAAVIQHIADRGDLPRDVDPHALLDMLAGAILYRSLLGAALTATLIEQLTDLVLHGLLPRTPALSGD
ncbi:MAG: TetR/AcrR family transcriptional regulator [Pseudonocardiaceae bacterium]